MMPTELLAKEPRKFDALVAEKVMGLHTLSHARCMNIEGWSVLGENDTVTSGVTPGDGYGSMQPVYVINEECKLTPEDEPERVVDGYLSWGLDVVKFYHSDPSADYSVLEEVRKTWTVRQQVAFAFKLMNIMANRTPYPQNFIAYENVLMYAPGDYALAALLVRMEGKA